MWTSEDDESSRLESDWFRDIGYVEGRDIYDIEWADGKPIVICHFHQGQRDAWACEKSIVAVIAGTQGGKTTFGPLWLLREILRTGGGDYLVAGPTFPLLSKKTIPEFRRLFESGLKLGTFLKADNEFVFDPVVCEKLGIEMTRVLFGHAQNPDSLESATVKAAWLDEAGQTAFRHGSFDAVQRRLLRYAGRTLITTTPYNLGWLYTVVYLPWEAEREKPSGHAEIEVVRFETAMNPTIGADVIARARRKLADWKFKLMYLALFVRPAGAIFDTWSREENTCAPFPIPASWRRIVGIDFGPRNTVAMFAAQSPKTLRWYVYAAYHTGKRPVQAHVAAWRTKPLRGLGPRAKVRAVGGAPSEDKWRARFARAGFPVAAPKTNSVEEGIDALHALITDRVLIVFDTLKETIEGVEVYSREVDDQGEVKATIENKSRHHKVDGLRYMATEIEQTLDYQVSNEDDGWVSDDDELAEEFVYEEE